MSLRRNWVLAMILGLIFSGLISACTGWFITPQDENPTGALPGSNDDDDSDNFGYRPPGGSTTTKPCSSGKPRCGTKCCGSEQVCQSDVCVDLGPACSVLEPCPSGFSCDLDISRCVPSDSVCEYHPPTGVFSPQQEWEWPGAGTPALFPDHIQVMMTPKVANMSDDNGDGTIDRNDIPDIIFTTFQRWSRSCTATDVQNFGCALNQAIVSYELPGVIRVLSGDGSGELLTIYRSTDGAGNPIPPLQYNIMPGAELAVGDIDADGDPEIVACGIEHNGYIRNHSVYAFNHDGTLKWLAPSFGCLAPAIADIDHDGMPEVVVRGGVLNGESGTVQWVAPVPCFSFPIVADLDADGSSEIVCGSSITDAAGNLLWQVEAGPYNEGALRTAVADLDLDGDAEIVLVSHPHHVMRAMHHDGTMMWEGVDIDQGHNDGSKSGRSGGWPTIANFDDDEYPEIAMAGGFGYTIFEHDGTPKWFRTTQDLSSRSTGSSVFDFEGDGRAEAVYNDELFLRIYDGETGDILFQECNTTGTLDEYPLIVDVDNDNHAEIVVAANNYAFTTCTDPVTGAITPSKTGIRVFGDADNNWVATRRIWNQHTYHVTNIDEDGRIPRHEVINWQHPKLNDFRRNVQPDGLFNAPDLVADIVEITCGSNLVVQAEITNNGAAKVVRGVPITLYAQLASGENIALGTIDTSSTLFPGESETVQFNLLTPQVMESDSLLRIVADDDGAGQGNHNECHEDNNDALSQQLECSILL